MDFMDRLIRSEEVKRVVIDKIIDLNTCILSGKIPFRDKVDWRDVILWILEEYRIPAIYLDMSLGDVSIFEAYSSHKEMFADLFLRCKSLSFMVDTYGKSISYYSHIRSGRRLFEQSSNWALIEGVNTSNMYRDRRGNESSNV